ncbi:MAG TPA: sulfotransferase [Terriglobales bacterium]|nr:sulfotransferase [Terriglobales bacterium]
MTFDFRTFLSMKMFEARNGAGAAAWTLSAAQAVVYPLVHVFFALDEVLEPAIKRVQIVRPTFIVGCPRSGTTMLFHLLASDTSVATYNLYNMLFPAITLRRIVPDAVREWFVRGFDSWFAPLDGIHPVHAERPEEDEILFMLLGSSGINSYTFPYGELSTCHSLNRFWQWRHAKRTSHLQFYRRCLQRLLWETRRGRYVGKSPHFLGKIDDLQREYPDALFVYAIRSPYECIPSALSFISTFWKIAYPGSPPDGAVKQLYDDLVALWLHGDQQLARIDDANKIVVRYEDLTRDPAAVVREIYKHAPFDMSSAVAQSLSVATHLQRQWRSAHRYSLEDFGLDSTVIRNDLAAIFSRHAFDG